MGARAMKCSCVPSALHLGAFAFLLGGCMGSPGAFGPDGYRPSGSPLIVRYAEPAEHRFVSADWRVDNFVVADDGTIGKPKQTDAYVQPREIDVDDDGVVDINSKAFVYDLKLVNRVTDGAIWLQTVPLAMRDKDRSLPSILDDFVESLSGTGVYRVTTIQPHRLAATKTYAAHVLSATGGRTGGFESVDATIELVNLDQLKVDPDAKSEIGRVVVVRTNYPLEITDTANHKFVGLAMVVVGCDSHPRDFDATNADFVKFLAALDFASPPR